MDDDFADVSWQNKPSSRGGALPIGSPRDEVEDGLGNINGQRHGSVGQLGRNPDAMDLAGVGEGILECTVTSPLKENDGTKDVYVSYLVTTHVCAFPLFSY